MTVTRQNLRQLIDITEHSYIFTKPYPEKSEEEEEEITRIAKEIIVTVTFHPRREPLFKVPRHMDEHREKSGPHQRLPNETATTT